MIEKVFASVASRYLSFVYRTSEIIIRGEGAQAVRAGHTSPDGAERFVIGFWHGESCACYPLLRDSGIYIITTLSGRGALVDALSRRFGYIPIRLPDESRGENHIFKVRSAINGSNGGHLAMSLDGPTGPRHEPKKLVPVLAMASRRRIITLSVRAKRKVNLRRWDKFMIPLPFNRLEFYFHEPLAVNRAGIDGVCADIARKAADDWPAREPAAAEIVD